MSRKKCLINGKDFSNVYILLDGTVVEYIGKVDEKKDEENFEACVMACTLNTLSLIKVLIDKNGGEFNEKCYEYLQEAICKVCGKSDSCDAKEIEDD